MPSRLRPVPLPHVTLTPVPDPPYDGERRAPEPATHGSLALAPAAPRPLVWGPPGSVPDERHLRHLGQALAEILTGRRPPETVADRLTDRAYAELVRAGRMIVTGSRPLVGRPHVKQPKEGAVEMCLLMHCGERHHVLAVRLERRGVQWLCTDFETA
ncbi:Rv3235 family protein [Nonomuraea roseola]|uniref:Rv3235 family protein n=1 Tax=Nonomuraea roseola TaxID=46179 RepID=A0ABV5PQY5_9ACTN